MASNWACSLEKENEFEEKSCAITNFPLSACTYVLCKTLSYDPTTLIALQIPDINDLVITTL